MLFRFKFIKHLVGLALIGLVVSGCGDSSESKDSSVTATDRAIEHLVHLSQSIGIRVAGSQEEAAAGDYIKSQFEALGYETTIQDFTFGNDYGTRSSCNIVAVKPGDSSLTLIVGAHYDSVNVGQGASDNASGVGLMLAMAERLRNAAVPYTILFIAFGAEEIGLVGSDHYVSQMTPEEIANTIGMINLDTVVGGDMIYVYGGAGEGGWLRDRSLKIAGAMGIDLQTNPGRNPHYPEGTTGDWSDHAPFKNAGIDYLYLEATNWEIGDLDGYTQTVEHGAIFHTEGDTIDFLEVAYPGRLEAQLADFAVVLEELLMDPRPLASMVTSAMSQKTATPPARYLRRDGTPYE